MAHGNLIRLIAAVFMAAALLAGTATGGGDTPGALALPRAVHTATALADGRVLIVGGCDLRSCEASTRSRRAEIFDPRRGLFSLAGGLRAPRVGHAAARLPSGQVLVVGGWRSGVVTATSEIFEPRRNSFTLGPRLSVPRGGFTLTPLADGRVLVAGGESRTGVLASAELYDPRLRRFRPTGSMTTSRAAHAAVRLRDGRVLIVGGSSRAGVLSSAEVFDPRSGEFRPVAAMAEARHKLGAALLPDGRVLVVGGSNAADGHGRYRSTELYDPGADLFVRGPSMHEPRYKILDAIAVLPSGEVVVAGGGDRAEIYDPRRARFRRSAATPGQLAFATATVIGRSRLLIAGGYDRSIVPRRQGLVLDVGTR